MKILYGVQGTGNGHLTRARLMAKHFKAAGIEVDYLFSGREPEQYFAMDVFGAYQTRTGLTFVSDQGAINYWRSFSESRPLRFISDVMALRLESYDLILTDFEPVTAWAGRLAGVPVIGMGHQYAFSHTSVPRAGDTWQSKLVMSAFAPVDIGLGLHWNSFGAAVLPPVIDHSLQRRASDHVLVYLPFEAPDAVTTILNTMPETRFVQYGAGLNDEICKNVMRKSASVSGFHRDLSRAHRVICNTGFELISECLHAGIPVMTKPVQRQSEQLANAAALQQLGYARVEEMLTAKAINDWLATGVTAPALQYPDVAAEIVGWISRGNWDEVDLLSQRLWQQHSAPPGRIAA